MTRARAALTHLTISATLAAIVIALIVFGWYPLPYFWALGGPLLLALIVGIDVVLGPLMTLILFNPRKSRRALTLDLSLIGIVQMAALVYGVYSGYVGRMAYGVFVDDRFHVVQASEIAPLLRARAVYPQFKSLPFVGHQIVGTRVPDTEQAKSDLTFYRAVGVGPQHMPEFYVPLADDREQLGKAAIPESQLEQRNPELNVQIQRLLDEAQLSWREVAVLPFETDTATYTAVVRLSDAALLKVFTRSP